MAEKNTPRLGENKMGTMPIGKLLVNMAVPMILSMLVQAFYNVVDSIYISHYDPNAVTALGMAFPVQNVQIGFAVGIGVGVNSLLSKSLGEGNRDRANRAAGNGIFLAFCATAIFMLFGLFGTKLYYSSYDCTPEILEAGISYTTICCVFTMGIYFEVLFEPFEEQFHTPSVAIKFSYYKGRKRKIIRQKHKLFILFLVVVSHSS